ncbi:MAG: hypothetical protein QXE95_01345 [Candidatus Nitrosocaldus sp.]
MTNKRSIVIAAAGVAVAAVLAFAVLAVGLGNGSIVKQEQKSKGNGMAEKLEFKNPVTIRLIDKDGNIASEKVVYNAITADGKTYIYRVLGNSNASIAALNKMQLRDATTNNPDINALKDNATNPVTATVANATITCTPSASSNNATCVGTFTFSPAYQPGAGASSLNLAPGKKIVVGHDDGTTFTPYFELTSIGSITVNPGTTYASLQITWTITVS